MTHLISVEPFGDGWTVRSDQLDNDMVFQRGAAAEAAAKILGDGLARLGQPAKIVIRLRDGTVAGQFVCAPVARNQAPPRSASRTPWNFRQAGAEPARQSQLAAVAPASPPRA
ncbi:hypothetical protein [Caulobacter sp. LARHSG274]